MKERRSGRGLGINEALGNYEENIMNNMEMPEGWLECLEEYQFHWALRDTLGASLCS